MFHTGQSFGARTLGYPTPNMVGKSYSTRITCEPVYKVGLKRYDFTGPK